MKSNQEVVGSATLLSTPAPTPGQQQGIVGNAEALQPVRTFKKVVKRVSFASGLFVAPNPIDFDKAFAGFSNLSENPVAFSTVLAIFGVYLIMLFWARREDRKDLLKVIQFLVLLHFCLDHISKQHCPLLAILFISILYLKNMPFSFPFILLPCLKKSLY